MVWLKKQHQLQFPKYFGLLAILILLSSVFSSVYAETIPVGQKAAKRADDVNRFTFEIYSVINKESNNVFFSPYSISSAFSMLYEGAQGTTRDELQAVFHYAKDDAERRSIAKSALSELNKPNGNYKLSSANALWVQKDYPILKSYYKILRENYSAKSINLDFVEKTEHSRIIINKWVESKTNKKITNLFPPNSITEDTKAVLTNAVYFKGDWKTQFDKKLTQDNDFKLTAQKAIKTPMMRITKYFDYIENDELQILKMPYKGDNLSMLVLLPKNDLPSLEKELTAEKLNEWKGKLARNEVSVQFPKFTMNTDYDLITSLSSMGITSVFSDKKADLSGITGDKDLYVNAAIHKAFVDVHEEGTEAAAATGIGAVPTSIPPPPKTFNADHPFIFLIQDDRTGMILFMGKVTDPTKKTA